MKINNDSSDTRLSKSNAKLIRFITSIFSYLFILASSTMIIYFANRRGNPVELKILYYTALVLNIAQIILVLSKFVIQQAGVFSRILYKIENILAIIWETVIAAEFAFSCILFKAFRLDSLLIVLMQGLAILLMLLYSRKIDYSVNKKHNQKSQKNGDVTLHNPSVLRGRELSKSILYVFTCLCVFILELTVLTIPKLPPKIDDIFSDTRVLEYEYYKNVLGYEDGYYVSDIYYGTNDKIVIPLTYNDIPVVGILEDSITDEGIINSIQIGEFDSTGVLKSNVKIIESEAINLNRIVELSLPESIEKIEKNAIFGKKIQTINIYFENSFTFDCFNTENLSTINIKNTNSVVEADYKNFNVEVKVPTNLYNRYRTKFFDNRNVFNLINDEDYIVIDFETNSNVYLDSKILDKNDAKLNITSLKNAGVETSSLINDTVLYNNDNYTCDGFQSKDGYAFRGWYRDENYTLECVFSDTHDISFNEDTTVYARWEEIKTIELDWSNYYPYNEKTTIIKYVASTDINESIIFPKLKMYGGNVEREGFKNLKWKLGNEYVEKTLDLANLSNKNIRLTAEWELETPKVTYETKANNTVYNGSNLTFTFDEDQIINYVASYSHESENVTITCKWKKQNADGDYTVLRQINTTNKDIFNYSLRNVADSGVYKLEIIAKANTGEQSTITHGYTININKKDIDVSLYGVMQPVTRVYNGNNQELKYNFVLPSNIKVSENYEVDGYYSTVAPVNASNEAYSVRYVFENISEDRDNYNVAYLYSYITITPKPVTAIWEQTESIWNNNFELIYDGSHHILTPIVDGICGTDKVSFVMKNSSEKDVGTYISTIIGVTNTNYKLDTFNTEQSHVWKILPKELTTSWGITESEYTGNNISFDFYIEGIVPVDVHNVSADDFVCITDCNDEAYTYNNGVLSFYAKDAGDYSVLLESFDNDNYIFKSNIKTLKITKSILSTSWSNTSIVYTGEKQFSKLTISGFKLGDEKRYTNDLINNYFVLQSECNYEILSQVNGKLEIAFYTKDVGTYSAKLEKIVNDNYLVSATSSYIIVSPKELTGSWINASLEYNGYEQGRIYRISNLAKEDVEKLSVDDFSIDFDGERYDLKPNVNAGYVDLCFYGKDAKTYNISINAFDTVNHNGNFTFSNKVKYSFVIKPRLLDVTWEEPSYVYDDSEKVIKVSKINNICANDDVDLLYTNNKAINAGTYTANIYSTNSNYITDSSHNKEWTIEKKQLTVLYEIVDKENKFLSKNSVIYDGNYKYFKLKYSGFEGDDLTTITTNNFNYSFNYSNISETGSGIEGNYYVSKFRAIDSKSYTITLTSHYLENYEVSIVRSFTISQKKANIEWNYTLPFIYSKTTCVVTPSVTNQCTRDDTGEKDLVSVNVSGNTGINAGTYTAVISSLSNNNYYVEDSVKEFNWTINPKVLKLSWNNPSLVFNAEHQQRYATATNLCTNDSVSFNYLYAKMNNVTGVYSDYSSTLTIDKGNYKTKVSSIFGMDANNYILASDIQESEYSIEARKLTASIVGTTYTYSGDSRSLITLTFSNFPTSTEASKFTVNNIDYQANVLMSKNNYSYTSCSFDFCATDAGIYNAVINGCINNDNYIFDVCSATGVITKKVIEVSWPTATYTYDGTAKSFIASINNIASGDSIEITYSYSGSSLLGDKITSNSMSDAGTYTVSIVSIDNDNYTIDEATNLSKIFTITPKALTVNYSGVSFTYDGDYQGMSLTISGYASKDKSLFASNPFVYTHSGCKAEYNSTNTTLNLYAVDAGTYNVKVSDLTNSFSNSNYILSSEISSSYVINPKTIPVTLSSTSLIYNGYVQTITPLISSTSMYTNVLTGKKDSVELSYSGNTAKNVGTYSVIINSMTGEDAKNYKLSSTTLNWYINKKNLTLTWDSLTTFTYNGQEQTVKLKISGFVGQDAKDKEILDFTTPTTSSYVSISEISKTSDSVILSFTKIDAGTYICKLNSISDLSNYSYSLSSCSFVIEKKVVQLTWDCLTTFTYDGTSHSIGCVVSNACLRSGSSTKDVINLTLSNNKKINAGTYTANVTGLSNNNYTLPSTNLTRTWQIKQVELKGLWSTMNDFVYDGTTHVLYLTVTGFINSSDSSAVTSSSFTSSRNYTVSSSSSNSVILEFNIKDAGKYSHTISSFNNQNYIINEEMKKEVEVTQKVLNISWSGASTYTYNGTNQGVYMYVSGIASSDLKLFEDYILVKGSSYLCTTEDDNLKFYFYDKNAGTYTASIDSVTNSNYKLPSINLSKSWQIKQAELNSSWSAMDNFVYDGTNHTLYLTIAGFVNNTDTSAITTSSFTSSMIYTIESKSSNEIVLKFNIKNVGEYSYSITAFNNSNYKLNAVSTKVVEVTPKEVTISWNGSNSYTYNGTSQGINMYLSGIASNDISSFKNYLSLTGNCTNSYDVTTNTNGINYYFYATNAGTYSITVKANSDLKNYKFITQNKSFTINKKTLTSNWISSTESWSDVYDGQINTISLVITGFVNGEKYTSSSFSSSTSISSYDNTVSGTLKLNFNVKDSGSYTFKVDSFSNNNYTFTSTSKTYTINPKALTVIWSGSSDVYSGLSQGYNLQITGIINSDCNSVKESLVYSGNISPKISSSLNSITYSFAAINAGTYSVNVKANSTLKNYTITSTSKTFEIEKRNIEVDVNSLKNGIITFTNLISGETINYDLNVYADENYTESISDWNYDGIYYYQINLVGADNYNLTNNSGSFKVGEA